ncbi:MAG: PqiC family protein [Candidatus Omnitrophota bacterium]|nr:PqiC family protein [Candidatus Omnitrophota bacterium]
MRRSGMLIGMFVIYVSSAMALSGCVSPSSSPPPRFYMLSAVTANEGVPTFEIPKDTIIEVGPVKIPDYQNRPQIVTQDKDKMLTLAQFDRWGESLDVGLARALAEDLTLMLPGATVGIFPSNYAIPVNYQVIIDVAQLESELDKDLVFAAQWSLIEPKKNVMLFTKRAEFRQPIEPHNYSGLAKTLGAVCATLGSQIAEGLSAKCKELKGPQAK